MKKIYSIITIIAVTFSVNAQKATSTKTSVSNLATSSVINYKSTASSTTTVLQPSSMSTCTVTAYTSGTVGYVAGTNDYGDKAKAQKYNLANYSLSLPTTVSAAGVSIFKKNGTTATTTVKIYADASGFPGTLLGTSLPVSISALTTGTAISTFSFSPAVTLTGAVFHVSFDFSATNAAAGDTVAIYETNDGCAGNTVEGSHELQSDGLWYAMTNTTTAGWGFISTDFAIFPQVTANMVSVVENELNSKSVSILPNPTSGLVNVVFTLANEENVVVSVSNTLGQVVSTSKFDGIANKMVSLDIANQPNGVYFVTISNGKDKMVQRLILNK